MDVSLSKPLPLPLTAMRMRMRCGPPGLLLLAVALLHEAVSALPTPARHGGIDSYSRYGTFRLNFHRFDRFEPDLRGHTQP